MGNGLLARFLNLPGLKPLGDASFSIFMLQMPVFLLVGILAYAVSIPSALTVTLMVVVAIVLSLLSTNYFEKPLSRKLRQRWNA